MTRILLITQIFLLGIGLAHAGNFTLSSPQVKNGALMNNQQVLNGFGCQGGNISPALSWKNPPAQTKSFAVTVYDPDAPTGSGWWHWVVFNIPANISNLSANSGDPSQHRMPAGSIQSRTDFGKPGYGGPCPPSGDKPHRYQFTVYALKTAKLPLDESAPAAMVGFYLHQNLLDKAVLKAKYKR